MYYRVIKFFTDLQDDKHPYHVGDVFPREGVKVTKKRLAELSGPKNRQGVPLIEAVEGQEELTGGTDTPEEPEE